MTSSNLNSHLLETKNAQNDIFIGIDVGSVSVNLVVLKNDGKVIEDHYLRIKGKPLHVVLDALEDLFRKYSEAAIKGIGTTGSGGKLIAELLKGDFVNEIIAQAKAVEFLIPEVRTIIEIGGEDSKLILLEQDQLSDCLVIKDFSMNTMCAAGTGSFLDQQASRLGISIEEEFGQLSLQSKNPPRMAGRCSVFAKSDMIHLQQRATPLHDIVAGLCYAMARNFKSNLAKGKDPVKPISFQGGVAANRGMVRAFEDVFELRRGELIIPQYHTSMGAIGAVRIIMEKEDRSFTFPGLQRLKDYLIQPRKEDSSLETLSSVPHDHLCPIEPTNIKTEQYPSPQVHDPKGKINAYLGIDVGSISTNVVAVDEKGVLLAKRYLMTAGRPIEAVRKGLEEIGLEIGDRLNVLGVGTTGSGRYLTGDFVGADVVKNEITAQARAAAQIDPTVDTIFEIGGQDSKFISLENGAIVDFEMNKVCAAGTGSFLEEQAERLDIAIKEEFGKTALEAPHPVRLGERCTVFMESDLVHYQQRGADKPNLVGGLCYSIVYNYLNRVVGTKKVGNNIFFQGGVAFNKGVIAAFEKVVGKRVLVPQHHEVTGAIGVSLLAKEEMAPGPSKFKGFQLSGIKYEISSFECKGCANICEVNKVNIEGEQPFFYGSKCDRYDRKDKKVDKSIPDLFEEREKLLTSFHTHFVTLQGPASKARVGIPRTLLFYEQMPFWLTFFNQLGVETVISDASNSKIIKKGVEIVTSETCFPIKNAHGHVSNLIEKGVDYIFLPSVINIHSPSKIKDDPGFKNNLGRNCPCPYVQTFPYLVRMAIDMENIRTKLLTPVIPFQSGWKHLAKTLKRTLKGLYQGPTSAIYKALLLAEEVQNKFTLTLRQRGSEIIEEINKTGKKSIVLVSRPYNGLDRGINLDLPRKLREMGVTPLPMDYLPLDVEGIAQSWPNMYWRYGQKILAAGQFVKRQPNLYPIYITNFGCGPDSFIITFFRKELGEKPFLLIEIDEHSADAGAITRCEAYLDSIKNAKSISLGSDTRSFPSRLGDTERTIYIPHMCDHAYAFKAAFQACGLKAEVIPQADQETLVWGRKFTSGKECYPCIITTGDMVKVVKNPTFDRRKVAFFMPSGDGPCRFGQYYQLHRLVLDDLGCNDVPIYAPDQGPTLYEDLKVRGTAVDRKAWQGVVAVDILDKLLRQTRPYEVNPGETDAVYQECLDLVCESILRDCLEQALFTVKHKFQQIAVDKSQKKPLIGVVGEIFVRSHSFSNNNLVREVEKLGGEVLLPPFTEWIYYTNYTRRRNSLAKSNYTDYFKAVLKNHVQHKDEKVLLKPFHNILRRGGHEPDIEDIVAQGEPYLHRSFEGEAIISIGKSIDFIKTGASGIINAMPFTCMPGNIVNAALKKLQENFSHIPCLAMSFDGQEETNSLARLEAFVYQARNFKSGQGL